MDDKFIMMGLDDERSKKIAEVLGNKTCKKIINYLAETKDASEKDIADALDIPLNTTEYNLKKLLKTGLVEKTKNFFWSKKGKKIPMYKLAKKHIIISPKSNPTMTALKTIIPVIATIAAIILLVNLLTPGPGVNIIDEDQTTMKTFTSQAELEKFLEENQAQNDYFERGGMVTDGAPEIASADAAISGGQAAEKSGGASDYSETNIQVEGVDEPDIVKNDGKYIYTLSWNKVVIVNAYPAENLEILSEINVSGARDLFINEDKLIVFSQDYTSRQESLINIYDITDRTSPKLEKEISVDGDYVSARMIGDYVYLVANQYVNHGNVALPGVAVDGVREEIPAKSIAYFPYPDTSYTFTNVLALDLDNDEFETQTYLTGASHTIYVSEDNIYLTYTKRLSQAVFYEESISEVLIPLLPSEEAAEVEEIMDSDEPFYEKQQEVEKIINDYSMNLKGKEKAEFDKSLRDGMEEFQIELQKKTEQTVIHKINIEGLDIEYITNGQVPGQILNQFAMDEHESYFRIATTTGNTWGNANSLNHMYVLDEDLEVVGSVDDLAEGERIYSTRFMGDRAYMVTFRQVDPLFVLDLSDPEDPEVLGQLKVTGYSSYLHPYDENHIIGIGREATEQGRAQGIKIALFDVSDVKNPIEKAKYEVKGIYSDSNALYDHKAFLFNKDRELLVLPMSYSFENDGLGIDTPRYEHWQGAFVFNINTEEISLRGQINHKENNEEEGYYYGPYAVQRSLYMDNTLYTISGTMIKANDLDTLDEINKLKLPFEEQRYYFADGMAVSEGNMGIPEVAVDSGVVSSPVSFRSVGRSVKAEAIRLN